MYVCMCIYVCFSFLYPPCRWGLDGNPCRGVSLYPKMMSCVYHTTASDGEALGHVESFLYCQFSQVHSELEW